MTDQEWVGQPTEGGLGWSTSGGENEGDRPRVGELVTRPRVGWVGHPTEGRLGWSISGADVPEVKTRVTDQGLGSVVSRPRVGDENEGGVFRMKWYKEEIE